jgi:hypothetical protein
VKICLFDLDNRKKVSVNRKNRSGWVSIFAALITFSSLIACGLSPNLIPRTAPDSYPTSTRNTGQDLEATSTPIPNRCDGLTGTLEMQIRVGPAEDVGLEPVSVGEIPFSVVTQASPYLVQGSGSLSYHETLEQAWGTYTVNLDMQTSVTGECTGINGSEQLNAFVDMNGDQLVEVRSDYFNGDYPFSGTHNLDLPLPLEEGATGQGEGWVFILHLSK